MFHITEQVEEVTILRTSCYGVRINRTARRPELSLRWRFLRKIQVRLTAPIISENGRFVNSDFQVFFKYFPERDQALIPPAGPPSRPHAKRLECVQLAGAVEGVGQSNYRR
jgi:hypothetical protein